MIYCVCFMCGYLYVYGVCYLENMLYIIKGRLCIKMSGGSSYSILGTTSAFQQIQKFMKPWLISLLGLSLHLIFLSFEPARSQNFGILFLLTQRQSLIINPTLPNQPLDLKLRKTHYNTTNTYIKLCWAA